MHDFQTISILVCQFLLVALSCLSFIALAVGLSGVLSDLNEGNNVDKVHLLLLFLSWVVYFFCINTLLIMERWLN